MCFEDGKILPRLKCHQFTYEQLGLDLHYAIKECKKSSSLSHT